MSAFIVSDHHINELVSYCVRRRVSYWTGKDRVTIDRHNAEEVGRILIDQNARSVHYRYEGRIDMGEKEAANDYAFKMSLGALSAVQAIKAANCLDYQSCETPDWEGTMAWRICQAIINSAIHDLPGYDLAEWELREELLSGSRNREPNQGRN